MSEQTLCLAEDADLDHENARDWYDSYGWHLTTENEGDLTLDVVEYHWLNEPDQEVVNHIRETYYDLTDEEVMSLIEKAREVRANAEAVEALLGEAVEAYGRGDVAAVFAQPARPVVRRDQVAMSDIAFLTGWCRIHAPACFRLTMSQNVILFV
jgi:hypothetical protein